MHPHDGRFGWGARIGVALTSAALMATEIALTRVLSVVVWYHFAFFAISLALLGLGLAALLVHLLRDRLRRFSLGALAAAAALGQALTTLVSTWVLVRADPDWFGGISGAFTLFTPKLAFVFACLLLPFVGGGFVLSLAAQRNAHEVQRVYFLDLLGAGLGCLAVIPLLSRFGGPQALASCATLAASAALAFVALSPGGTVARRVLWIVAPSLVFASLLASASTGLELRHAKGIDLARTPPELTRWNSYSLVSVFSTPGFRGWGLSPKYDGPIPEQKTLVIDMNALTSIARFDGDFEAVKYVLHDMSALAYRIAPAKGEVCVVGAGGGKDVLTALAAGAKRVTAVEINPLIVDDVMRGAYAEFAGGLYDRPDVEVRVDDGRNHLRTTSRRFDVITISMVDTSAATAAGAYALTENGLYTWQAMSEFLARLRPSGLLSISTVSLEGLAVGARLASLARQALVVHGTQPASAVAVARTPWLGTTGAALYNVIVKPDGFSAADADAYRQAVSALGFEPAYVPDGRASSAHEEDRLIARILREPRGDVLAATLAEFPLDVSAADDDRPFFFYQNRLRDFARALLAVDTPHLFGNGLRVLAKVLVLSFGGLVVCLLLPLAWARRERAGLGADLVLQLLHVALLGVGFMCLEIALVHRVTLALGQPTYTLVVVLFTLLVGGGLGSRLLAPRVAGAARVRALVFGSLVLLVCALAFGADAWLRWSAGSTLQRALWIGASLAPLALLLGAPLPAALLRVAEATPSRIAWLWGVNGAASVFGSIVGTLIALHEGTRATLLVGGLCYLLCAVSWVGLRARSVPAEGGLNLATERARSSHVPSTETANREPRESQRA